MINDPHQNQKIALLIKERAMQLGFDACGFVPASAVEKHHQKKFKQWIDHGQHGKMQYMANYTDKRMDPRTLVPDIKSIISLAYNYHQLHIQPSDAFYRVSSYSAGVDYHDVLKKKLYQLLEFVNQQTDIETARVFTDSAPVLERYWAQKAGLGAPGKNSCLILPQKGSFFFLAEILIDLELPYDTPYEKDLCGSCTRCIDACPTKAIISPGIIESRRCISYLTIELKDNIPEDLEPHLSQNIFGCDICQQVCPHNIKFAKPCNEPEFQPLHPICKWTKTDWENLDKSLFRKHFVKTRSPIARISFEKLRETIKSARS
jgi:epoxyqueuosine reductase